MLLVDNIEIAEHSLRKLFTMHSCNEYLYPEILALHGLTKLALATDSPELLAWNKALLKPLIAGKISHSMGAYYLYNIGRTSTVRLLAEGNYWKPRRL